MDTGNYTSVMFLDLKKVFDMITHAMFSDKLKLYELDNI